MTRSVFAIEMCIRHDPEMVAGVRGLLANASAQPSAGELWHMWRTTASELQRRQAAWVSGCWDFWDTAEKAQSDFQMWVNGLMTEEGARTAPSGSAQPYRGGDERFMTITMAALLVHGTQAERAMRHNCDIPEAVLWQPASFHRVLTGIAHVNFAVVDSSTLYMIPRDDAWALTADDLRLPKFEYLRPIASNY